MTTPPLESWLVANARVTAFPVEPVKIDTLSWWSDLVGHTPESVTSRPKTAQREEVGEVEGRQLTLKVEPERIDWVLTPAPTAPEDTASTLPVAGPFPEVTKLLYQIMASWMPHCPKVTRLAFGAVLLQPVADRRTGYVEIVRYLPALASILDPDRSSDFFFQINRPRTSTTGITGLTVNRLTKWSVMLLQSFRLTVAKSQATTVGHVDEKSACRLELDINTGPDYPGPLPHEALVAILGELVGLSEEIATRGDIP